MAQYIDKAAIMAEIERYISNYREIVVKTNKNDSTWVDSVSMIDAKIDVLKHLLFFLDSLEVKKEPISEDLEEAASRYAKEEYNRKSPATLPDRCRGCYSPLMYAFKAGAEWQKEQMIDKACKWLKSYRQDTPDGTGYVAGIVNDKTIEEFKQAIEE